MKAMSKSSSEINEPIAFFEMGLHDKSRGHGAPGEKIAKFEMSRDEIQNMLHSIQEIQTAYDKITTV
jgi:hypothetical protein